MRNPIPPDSPQAFITPTSPTVGIVANGIILRIILVIAFIASNRVKGICRQYRGYHGLTRKHFNNLLPGFFCYRSFFRSGDKYSTEVAMALVTKLTPGVEWVYIHPIMVQNSLITDYAGIVGNLDRFVMSRMVTIVSRVF